MTENDVEIAKSLGKKASFCGLRTAESAVCAQEPCSTRPPSPVEDDTCRAELLHQLSTVRLHCYDISYHTIVIAVLERNGRRRVGPAAEKSRIQQELDEHKEMLRFQRLILEKQYAVCTKMDALLDKISIRLEIVGNGRTRQVGDHYLNATSTLGGDPNVEDSII
ncbi:unnamed protein product [Cylicocyclus nassatus]|uniref:Uncharacterized protein n=1 Tax=Cylicocyclus nassatus TaxID=53992 RepID=A0AA36GP16_CYLNA|nr:unnamed protein product [Cylicocyclus nassatus]